MFLLYFVFLFFFTLKIYILIHIRLCGSVSDKKNFTRPISGNKTTFFWTDVKIDKIEKFLNAYFMFSINCFHMYAHSDLKLLLPNFIVFRKWTWRLSFLWVKFGEQQNISFTKFGISSYIVLKSSQAIARSRWVWIEAD